MDIAASIGEIEIIHLFPKKEACIRYLRMQKPLYLHYPLYET